MSAFHVAIAVTLNSVDFDVDSSPDTNVQASLVLDMDEMVNIKNTLRHFGQTCCMVRGDEINDASGRRCLGHQGVNPKIIDWVMGE